jgi:hypothetical protein
MATSRRKTSGFTSQGQEEETQEVEKLLDDNAREMFETTSHTEEEVTAEVKAPEPPKPVTQAAILPEIIPTEDAGPRFVQPEATPRAPQQPAPQLKAPPQRHPRNVPKFSRFK